MKSKTKIFFHPLEGSAPLSAYWFPGPYGDAIEAKEQNGVYFSAPNGDLLGVQFDDVNENKDKQTMTTLQGTKITVTVKAGKVSVKVEKKPRRVA